MNDVHDNGHGRGAAPFSRRRMLLLMGGAVGAVGMSSCAQPELAAAPYNVNQWRQERGDRYLIAHRGSGDVVPEHTLEAYQAALDWGAKALEISVVMTSDGVLICQHDLTYDRTTTLRGLVSSQPSSVLQDGRVDIGRLGPRWQGDGRPRIARLDDTLRRIGRRAVLCIEPKDDNAYPPLVRMIEEQGLRDTVILKLEHTSPRISGAKAAGYPVFAYIGTPDAATPSAITQLASRLDKGRDVLVLPSTDNDGPLPVSTIEAAVATGVPVWVFPVHRRWETDYFFGHGVSGVLASSYGYLARSLQPLHEADWKSGAIASGEMTQFPDSDKVALQWPEPGVITLAAQQRQAFLTLGQLAPLERPKGPYQIDLEIRVDQLPSDSSSNFTLAFGHADDRYYEHRQGTLDGYHAMLRMDGTMELRKHRAGSADGVELGPSTSGSAPATGTWVGLRLTVGQDQIGWTRTDTGATVIGSDRQFRGDVVHIGRSSVDGKISIRSLKVV